MHVNYIRPYTLYTCSTLPGLSNAIYASSNTWFCLYAQQMHNFQRKKYFQSGGWIWPPVCRQLCTLTDRCTYDYASTHGGSRDGSHIINRSLSLNTVHCCRILDSLKVSHGWEGVDQNPWHLASYYNIHHMWQRFSHHITGKSSMMAELCWQKCGIVDNAYWDQDLTIVTTLEVVNFPYFLQPHIQTYLLPPTFHPVNISN